jgi:hypothetical protein
VKKDGVNVLQNYRDAIALPGFDRWNKNVINIKSAYTII